MKYKIHIITAVSILAILLIINQLFFVIPRDNAIQAETRKSARISEIKSIYYYCQQQAEKLYDEDWQGQCTMLREGKDCGLAPIHAERIGKVLQNRKDRCFEEYKLEARNK